MAERECMCTSVTERNNIPVAAPRIRSIENLCAAFVCSPGTKHPPTPAGKSSGQQNLRLSKSEQVGVQD